MNRSVCEELPRCDVIQGSQETTWNQYHRDVIRSRSRSPIERRWRGRTSGEVVIPFQDFSAGREAIPVPQRDYHSILHSHDFGEGRWNGGASWPYFHNYSASHDGHSDVIRESSRGKGPLDSSNGRRPDERRVDKIPCKFYRQGGCRRGQNCRYLHDSSPQSEMGFSVPVAVSVHTSAHNWYPHDSAPQKQMESTTPVAVLTDAHVLSRYNNKNPNSPGTFGNGTRHEYNSLQSKYAGWSQNNMFPSEDFGPQQQLFLTPSRTSEDSINRGQTTHSTTGSLSLLTRTHDANLMAGQNLGQIAQSQEAIRPIHGVPTHPFTTHLPNATASWHLNSQMHQNGSWVQPKRLGEFFVPQAGANNPALSVHSVPLGANAFPDLSTYNGHNFSVNHQIPQNITAAVHAGQSKETAGVPRHGQDIGTQSTQNTQDLQPAGANVQTQRQNLQELSFVPYSGSTDQVGAPISHNAATSEDARIINPYLATCNGKAPLTSGPVGKRPAKRNLDPRLVANSSAAPPSVKPNQQEEVMIQPGTSVSSSQRIHTFKVAIDKDGNPVIVSHSVELIGHAANSAKEDKDDKQTKVRKTFKAELTTFVKGKLQKTYDGRHLTKELYKRIVEKVIENIMRTEKNIPDTKQKIDNYLSSFRKKISKLIQDYMDIYKVKLTQ